ncbi:aromatic amino acid aminotransferase, partial [Pseudomonas syringae pv. tagetis]
VYCDEDGRIPLQPAVAEPENNRDAHHAPRGYLPIDGIAAYDQAVQKLLLGTDSPLFASGHVLTTQSVGGAGALMIGAGG